MAKPTRAVGFGFQLRATLAALIATHCARTMASPVANTSSAAIASNATGQLALDPAYLSLLDPKPQGATADEFGFRFLVDVIADEPDKDDGQLDKYVTDTAVSLLPPKTTLLGGNSTASKQLAGWKACWFVMASAKLQVSGDTVNENCTGILEDKCLKALQNDVVGGGSECPQPYAPTECDGIFGFSTGANTLLGSPGLAHGDFYNDVLYGGGSNTAKVYNHDKGSTSVYDRAIRQVLVGRVAYINEGLNASSTAATPSIPGAVKCLRVDKFAPGSRTRSGAVSLAVANANVASTVAVMAGLFIFAF